MLEVPAKVGDAKMPLLVVLHGDRERAAAAAARWRAAAKARGWALLALQCPTDHGCKGSWWQWNGDPSWVRSQIAKVTDALPIDPTKIALAGWSGGATYLGLRAREWRDQLAGVVIHGGGMAPTEDGCSPYPLRGYFLVGDQNPLHHLARDLAAHFEHCRHERVWDVIRGAGHAREEAALDRKKAIAILDWLSSAPAKSSK